MIEAGPAAQWREALAAGRILLQRDRVSGALAFPPRVDLASEDGLDWVEAGGGGTVYSVTVVRARPPVEPYNVALVDLDEGPRLMGRVVDVPPEDVAIGLRVRAFVGIEDGEPILLFRPEQHG